MSYCFDNRINTWQLIYKHCLPPCLPKGSIPGEGWCEKVRATRTNTLCPLGSLGLLVLPALTCALTCILTPTLAESWLSVLSPPPLTSLCPSHHPFVLGMNFLFFLKSHFEVDFLFACAIKLGLFIHLIYFIYLFFVTALELIGLLCNVQPHFH